MLRNFWRKTLGKEDVQKPEQSGWEFNYAMDFVRQTFTVKTWQCIMTVRISSIRKKEWSRWRQDYLIRRCPC